MPLLKRDKSKSSMEHKAIQKQVDEYRCLICGGTALKVAKDESGIFVEHDNVGLSIAEIELFGTKQCTAFICRDCLGKLTQHVVNMLRERAELEDVDYLGILNDDIFPYRLVHYTGRIDYAVPNWEVYVIPSFSAFLKVVKACRDIFTKSFIYYLEIPNRIECSHIPKRFAVYYLTMIPQDIARHKIALRTRLDSIIEYFIAKQKQNL